ncbi:hypothetical protein DEO72_LG5g261 [Vigna unguiculata]|uniref:Wall-associated receptor kinase n=1 Tax=Vigna unguiculata TaxID=3917 RepID=A0A4D6LUT6_VIGUN|nr:hypothetical protein DEO72_LG5g261 [Vigna unguiculata]
MDDKHSHLLAFALTVSWLLLIALPHSHSQPSPCAKQSYRCNISVSAIFDPPWEQIPASQCNGADTSSLLSCHVFYDNVPIESQNFTVKDINNTAHTMKVMLTPPVTDVCSPHFLNFDYQTFNNTLLQYNASVHKIIIFRNCPIIPKFPSKRKFTCGDVLYYFEEEEMLHRYPPLQNCTGRWEVPAATPLDGYDDSNDGAGVLEQALNDAFEVNYSIIPDGCCRESEGTCWRDGYYGEHVVSCNYYCPNQNCSPKGGK